MNIEDFIKLLEEEFEDIKLGVLNEETKYREEFEWNSINALIMIALVDTEYDVTITADDITESVTIRQLYDRILSKQKE